MRGRRTTGSLRRAQRRRNSPEIVPKIPLSPCANLLHEIAYGKSPSALLLFCSGWFQLHHLVSTRQFTPRLGSRRHHIRGDLNSAECLCDSRDLSQPQGSEFAGICRNCMMGFDVLNIQLLAYGVKFHIGASLVVCWGLSQD